MVAACGKKGPPLAPVVRIPAAVSTISAQRVGSDAFVTLTVPATNIDKSVPVDISRIEVYGLGQPEVKAYLERALQARR